MPYSRLVHNTASTKPTSDTVNYLSSIARGKTRPFNAGLPSHWISDSDSVLYHGGRQRKNGPVERRLHAATNDFQTSEEYAFLDRWFNSIPLSPAPAIGESVGTVRDIDSGITAIDPGSQMYGRFPNSPIGIDSPTGYIKTHCRG